MTLHLSNLITWTIAVILGVVILLCMPGFVRQVGRFFTTMANQATDKPLYSIAFVTAPDIDVAKKISRILVEQKAVACVNIVPAITSIYEWDGKIEEDKEVLMMLKTRSSRIAEVSKIVSENHPYDVPEVIATEITQGHGAYLKWIGDTVLPSKDQD